METRLIFIITALVLSTITIVVCAAVNATVANEPDNDLGRNTGWGVLMPIPAISFVWSIVDLGIYKLGAHHCVYWLVQSVLLCAAYLAVGVTGVLLYAWNTDGAIALGAFHLIMAVLYLIATGFAAKEVNAWRHRRRVLSSPAKNAKLADDSV